MKKIDTFLVTKGESQLKDQAPPPLDQPRNHSSSADTFTSPLSAS